MNCWIARLICAGNWRPSAYKPRLHYEWSGDDAFDRGLWRAIAFTFENATALNSADLASIVNISLFAVTKENNELTGSRLRVKNVRRRLLRLFVNFAPAVQKSCRHGDCGTAPRYENLSDKRGLFVLPLRRGCGGSLLFLAQHRASTVCYPVDAIRRN